MLLEDDMDWEQMNTHTHEQTHTDTGEILMKDISETDDDEWTLAADCN